MAGGWSLGRVGLGCLVWPDQAAAEGWLEAWGPGLGRSVPSMRRLCSVAEGALGGVHVMARWYGADRRPCPVHARDQGPAALAGRHVRWLIPVGRGRGLAGAVGLQVAAGSDIGCRCGAGLHQRVVHSPCSVQGNTRAEVGPTDLHPAHEHRQACAARGELAHGEHEVPALGDCSQLAPVHDTI